MRIDRLCSSHRPLLILAPMQDVTDLPFWRLMHHYGGADLYYTEYFRVHRDSKPEKSILKTIHGNPTGKPVIAQMIGEDIPSLIRTAKALQKHPVIGIDLNLGCPAPIVCRKNAGGGLLRDPEQIDRILGALREVITINFTVKTRVGYENVSEFERLLDIFAKHSLDALTVHGRTVREMYRPLLHEAAIAEAVCRVQCPVFANGNVFSIRSARRIAENTGANGLMIGRGAIRHPWIFEQIRQDYEGKPVRMPTRRDLLEYIRLLYRETRTDDFPERAHVSKMKKYLNYIAPGIGDGDSFLYEIRRVREEVDFWRVCEAHLADPLPLEPETSGYGLRN